MSKMCQIAIKPGPEMSKMRQIAIKPGFGINTFRHVCINIHTYIHTQRNVQKCVHTHSHMQTGNVKKILLKTRSDRNIPNFDTCFHVQKQHHTQKRVLFFNTYMCMYVCFKTMRGVAFLTSIHTYMHVQRRTAKPTHFNPDVF